MIVHVTKKFADKLKLNPNTVEVTDELLSWRAHYIQESGARFVIFMNDATRFSIVINDAKVAKLKKLPELFFETLRETLLSLGVTSAIIEAYIADLGEVQYAKNSDRKKTAQLNKNIDGVWASLPYKASDVELSHSSSHVFHTIGNDKEYFYAHQLMVKFLKRYELASQVPKSETVTDFAALMKWNKLSKEDQERLLSNAFCRNCFVTTVVDYRFEERADGIVVKGKCKACGDSVARVIENEWFS